MESFPIGYIGRASARRAAAECKVNAHEHYQADLAAKCALLSSQQACACAYARAPVEFSASSA